MCWLLLLFFGLYHVITWMVPNSFTHPGVCRKLFFLKMLPQVNMCHIIFKTIYFIPFWSFIMNIGILKALKSPTIKNPLILFILLFSTLCFLYKTQSWKWCSRQYHDKFLNSNEIKKSKLVIICWACNEQSLRIIMNNNTWLSILIIHSFWVKIEYLKILVI